MKKTATLLQQFSRLGMSLVLFAGVSACGGSGQMSTHDSSQSHNGTQISGNPYFLSSIAAESGVAVAAGGSGFVLVSQDGTTWSVLKIPNSTHFTALAAGGGQFLTAGLGGQAYATFQNQATDVSQWKSLGKASDAPRGNIRGATYFEPDDVFVMVDDQGGIYYTRGAHSIDGAITQITTESQPFFAITTAHTQASPNLLVAIGAAGTILTSSDLLHWQPQQVGGNKSASLYAITAPPSGTIVAVGENGTIVTSVDGIHWQAHTVQGHESAVFTGINYNNNQYTITQEATGDVLLLTLDSQGKITSLVTPRTGIPHAFYGITAFNNKNLVAGENAVIAISTSMQFESDAHNTPNADIHSAVYAGNNNFVLLGSQHSDPHNGYIGKYSYNTSINQWGLEDITPNGLKPMHGGTYAADQNTFISVGESGQIAYTKNDNLSKTGLSLGQAGTGYTLNAIDYFNGIYAAVGNDTINDHSIIYTTNPATTSWSVGQQQPETHYIPPFGDVFSITHDKNHFVTIAKYRYAPESYALVNWDGVNTQATMWTALLPNINGQLYTPANDIFYAESKTFMVGDVVANGCSQLGSTVAFITPDAGSWTSVCEVAQQNLYKITYDSSMHEYIVVGAQGTVVTSPDGINWSQPVYADGVVNDLHGVACGNGLCVAAGDRGTIINRSFGFKQVYAPPLQK